MAAGGGADSQATWRALVEADYFTVRGHQCPSCASGRDCNNFFCVKCKVGGLCPARFHTGGDHSHHPWLQVRKVTHGCAALEADLSRFMASAKVDQMQKYSQNNQKHCKFLKPRAKSTPSESSRRNVCHGCGYSISSSETPNFSDAPVCSLECLLDHAEGNPEEGSVRLVLSATDGAMAPPAYKPRLQDAARSSKAPVDREQAAEISGDEDEPMSESSGQSADDSEVVPRRPVPGQPWGPDGVIIRDYSGFSGKHDGLDSLVAAIDSMPGEWDRNFPVDDN